MAWAGSQGSGGGEGKVGSPGRTMEFLNFDEKTRPITRTDLLKFLADEKNTSPEEKELIQNTMIYGVTGSTLGFIAGYALAGLLPWRWIEKRNLAPFKGFRKFGRFAAGMTGMAIPFMVVQQWTVQKIMALDEMNSVLAFHAKRLMITQRSALLFTRSQVREVTKEEQKQLGMQNVQIRQRDSKSVGGEGKSIDVDLAMQQQVLTPVAQTGYKKM